MKGFSGGLPGSGLTSAVPPLTVRTMSTPHLNYHHLYYFKVIATEGSVSKAAVRLRLGQPTLSMQLKQFEDVLGFQLFERKNRSLVLTEMGRVVLTYASEIFDLGDEMLRTLANRDQDKPRTKLTVGALDSVPKSVLQGLMKKAMAVGDCQTKLLEGRGADLMKDLLEHRLDLVVSNAAPPSLTEERIYSRSISKMPLLVCGALNFQGLKERFPYSLQGRPFVLPTGDSRARHDFEQFLESQNLAVNILAETQDTSLMISLAIEGRGLIVASELAVREPLRRGELQVIGQLTGFFEELWLISAQRKIQNPIAKSLMKDFSVAN